MSILDRFFDIFRQPAGEEAGPLRFQTQREGLFDLLILTMYADHHLALSEQEMIDAQATDMDWHSMLSFGDFMAESVVRARDVAGGRLDQVEYLQDIGRRLGQGSGPDQALQICQQLMSADGKIREEEVDLLKQAQRIFSNLG